MTVVDFLSLRQFLIAVGFSAGPLVAAHAPTLPLTAPITGEHAEQMVALGLADDGMTVIDVLSNPDGETWTLLYSLATGQFCVVAGGRRWEIQTHPMGQRSEA